MSACTTRQLRPNCSGRHTPVFICFSSCQIHSLNMQVKSYELRLGFCQRTWSTWPTSPHKPVARQPEHWAQEQPRVVQWGIPGFSIGQTTPPGWMEGNSKLLRGSECVNCGTEGLACPLWIGIIIHWSECVIRGLPQILLQLWTFQPWFILLHLFYDLIILGKSFR